MNADQRHLPRLLCIHGRGTSGLIFSFQARKLTYALRHRFRCIFVTAPIESEPGAGVLPIFETAGPFFGWTATNEADEDRVRSTLQQELEKEDGAPLVGVLGFSQGGKIAAGLLHEHEQTSGAVPGLWFGVIINSSYPPLRQASNPSATLPRLTESARKEWDDQHEACIHLPSIHVHGRSDEDIDSSRLLVRCFDPATATVMEFDSGHHLPLSVDDTQEVADEIWRVYQQQRQKYEEESTANG